MDRAPEASPSLSQKRSALFSLYLPAKDDQLLAGQPLKPFNSSQLRLSLSGSAGAVFTVIQSQILQRTLVSGEKIAAGDIVTRDFRFEPLIALFRATPPDNPAPAFRKLLFDSF